MNEKLGIQDLVDLLARKHAMTRKDAEVFVKEFFQLIEEALETDKYVKIKGLGTFKLISVDSRESVKVNTGERFQIEGHTKVSFTPEPTLRDIINRPFSHFETVVLNEYTVFDDLQVENEGEEEELPKPTLEKPKKTPEEPMTASEKTEEAVEDAKVALSDAEVALGESKVALEETKELVEEPQESIEKSSESVEEKPVEKKSSSMRYFIGVTVAVVLLCIGAVVFLYYPDWIGGSKPLPKVESKPVVESKQVEKAAIVATDTLTIPAKTVAEEVKPAVEQLIPKKDAPMPADNGRSFKPDSTSYKIVGTEFTYQLGKGEMLTKVALRFYGKKALWPYLVEHNRDIIKNPNSVPSGITLKIPRLEKKQ